MRKNLIMNLFCSECSGPLNLVYGEEVGKQRVDRPTSADPTGAACRYIEKIHVEPCKHCIEKNTRPAKALEALGEAILQLQSNG